MDQQDRKETEVITPEQINSLKKAGLIGEVFLKAFDEVKSKFEEDNKESEKSKIEINS